MTRELDALARALGREAGLGAGGIGAMHAAIAARVFSRLGPAAEPARRTHDAISAAAYAAVAGSATLAGRAAGAALPPRELSTTRRGAMALAVLAGLHGDRLEAEGSPLHVPLALRVDGCVAARPGGLPGRHGAPGRPRPRPDRDRARLAARRLATATASGSRATSADAAVRPLQHRPPHLRQRPRPGRAARDAVAAWPVPVESIALVGHSMGGLVARSACHHGRGGFGAHVRHVVSLGTPHAGAPLAQGVHYAAHALAAVPETRPLARMLRRRSAGIRDLRPRPSSTRLGGPRPGRAARGGVRRGAAAGGRTHCFVTCHDHARPAPSGRAAVGDWLVLEPSARGRGRVAFDAANGLHVGGAHHLALLNHPAVYAKLREWLERPPARRTSTAAG